MPAKTLRAKLLTAFFIYTGITLLLLFAAIYFMYRTQQTDIAKNHISEIQALLLQDVNTLNEFFAYETINPVFFETGQSSILQVHDSLSMQCCIMMKKLEQLPVRGEVARLIHQKQNLEHLQIYIQLFDSIVGLIRHRGFKDYGMVGAMRRDIHRLEQTPRINLFWILTIRRHEKDYIIRNQDIYISKLATAVTNLQKSIRTNSHFSKEQKVRSLELLKRYHESFSAVVELDKTIGLRNNTGLKQQIDTHSKSILNNFNQLVAAISEYKDRERKRAEYVFFIFSALLIFTAAVLGVKMSERMTRRLSKLSGSIQTFVKSGFQYSEIYEPENKDDEIGRLVKNYGLLQTEILSLINDFKQRVAERTEQITKQRDQIKAQNEEIIQQRDELVVKQEEIMQQKQDAEFINAEIMAGIRYAKRIQEALMPNAESIKSIFPESFVFWQPKDIVSGDFYLVKHIRNSNFNIKLLIVADSTGHGVPGALMSMLGIAFLNEIIQRKSVLSASDVLNSLRDNIAAYLQNDAHETKSTDGMDIALLIIDEANRRLQFAGAARSLIQIRAGELTEWKGDRMSVGKTNRYIKKDFQTTSLTTEKGDSFYLFSDGYTDQFGGPYGKKFKKRNLKELLLNIAYLSPENQKEILADHFDSWKADLPQTDDVLVCGIRI